MRELFGGRRPRRVDEAAEDFLHRGLRTREDVRDDATDVAATVAPPAVAQIPSPRPRRSAIRTVAALTLAVPAGGGDWLRARPPPAAPRAPRRSPPPPRPPP